MNANYAFNGYTFENTGFNLTGTSETNNCMLYLDVLLFHNQLTTYKFEFDEEVNTITVKDVKVRGDKSDGVWIENAGPIVGMVFKMQDN